MDGILIVNKPKGMTSHDVIAKLRRAYKMKKIGHTGTLDPEVEGTMVICFGRATKLVPYLTNTSKTYTCTICIGIATDTEDLTGMVTNEVQITPEQSTAIETSLPKVLESFIGQYEQIPPMYSAVKIDGKKLYEYARANQEVTRTARPVEVFSIEQEQNSYVYENNKCYYTFTAKVSKGTYVRTLCVDIGEKMGYPATMAALLRTASGGYDLTQAINLDDALSNTPSGISLHDIELELPNVTVTSDVAAKLLVGYKLPKYFVDEEQNNAFAVRNEATNELVGIFHPSEKYPDKYESLRII